MYASVPAPITSSPLSDWLDVGVDGVGHHHAGEHRLHRLGHQRLQRDSSPAACARPPSPSPRWCGRPRRRRSCVARDRARASSRRRPRRRSAPRRMPVTSQFWMMSTPSAWRRARSPRRPHRGAPRRRAAAGRRPGSGSACSGDMFSGGQNALACSGVSHSLSMPFSRLAWTWRLNTCTSCTLCASIITPRGEIHDVVVQLLRQALPQLQRVLVERGALVPR